MTAKPHIAGQGPPSAESCTAALASIAGPAHAIDGRDGAAREWLSDATAARGLHGRALAVVRPGSPEEVAEIVRWCYANDVAITPRGGGTGLAGGAVPDGGIVLSLDRLDAIRSLDPGLWRVEVEAGVHTQRLQRVARESGLLFPPDPGAAEQSTIGGNIATNAGGPHAFKYGATSTWVTGVEAVVAPGEIVQLGGPMRKDVAGYDLVHLMVGSEGTLGIVTAAWLRLIPAPEAVLPVIGFYPSADQGCAAVEQVLAAGVPAAALEYLDEGTVRAARPAWPFDWPAGGEFMVLGEADGDDAEAERVAGELAEALEPGAVAVQRPAGSGATRELWRWRDGVSLAVAARRGGKVSEDIAVPVDRLREAIEGTVAVGAKHGLESCSWGHAGDGNLHATFMVDAASPNRLAQAAAASQELFAMAVQLGGSITGEHGLGTVKSGWLGNAWSEQAIQLHESVKRSFDPKGLLNPGKAVLRTA